MVYTCTCIIPWVALEWLDSICIFTIFTYMFLNNLQLLSHHVLSIVYLAIIHRNCTLDKVCCVILPRPCKCALVFSTLP